MAILFQLIGLAFIAFGAAIASRNLVIYPATARRLAGVWDGNKAFEDALVTQSRKAAIGLGLIVFGAGFQFVGTGLIGLFSG